LVDPGREIEMLSLDSVLDIVLNIDPVDRKTEALFPTSVFDATILEVVATDGETGISVFDSVFNAIILHVEILSLDLLIHGFEVFSVIVFFGYIVLKFLNNSTVLFLAIVLSMLLDC